MDRKEGTKIKDTGLTRNSCLVSAFILSPLFCPLPLLSSLLDVSFKNMIASIQTVGPTVARMSLFQFFVPLKLLQLNMRNHGLRVDDPSADCKHRSLPLHRHVHYVLQKAITVNFIRK